MSLLEETLRRIKPAEKKKIPPCMEAVPDSLGVLKKMLLKFSAATGREEFSPTKKCTVIACADHGVAETGTSAYPQETTRRMAANYLISRGAAANAFAAFTDSELVVVDMGMADDSQNLPGIIDRRIAAATKNAALGAAMTRDEAVRSVEAGIEIALRYAENGADVFLPGEMGIANTTISAAICAVCCGISPEEATGRGTNISNERLQKKIGVVRRIIEVNAPDPADGIDVLAKIGGFEFGCIAGIILGAAASRAVVILDGFNTAAAALVAQAIAPNCIDYVMASHLGAEKGHGAALKKLGLSPFMNLNLRLGEACGSSIAAYFLDAAINICDALNNEPDEHFPQNPEDFEQSTLEDVPQTVSDNTFNFYINTMPSLDRASMEKCKKRIDSLTKPIDCMGFLEEIAVELAGILQDERPEAALSFCMLIFFHGPREPGAVEARITGGFIETAADETTIFPLHDDLTNAAAFGCGRAMGEDISFRSPVMGLALWENEADDAAGTKAKRLKDALLDENGKLVAPPDEILRFVPKDLKRDFCACMGAIISAAHNSSLIILDDEATEIIARCAQKLCPEVSPYILHVQPALLQLGITQGGGILSCFGMILVDAALAMLNSMKTFDEANVPTANDGPGKKRQNKI